MSYVDGTVTEQDQSGAVVTELARAETKGD